MHTETEENLFTIGTASKLTNIPVNTIRTWERRYFSDLTMRSETGRRHFNEDSIQRLRYIKTLSDNGFSVRDLAKLEQSKLESLLQKQPSKTKGNQSKSYLAKAPVTLTGAYFMEKLTHFQNNYSVINTHNAIEDLFKCSEKSANETPSNITHLIDYKEIRNSPSLNSALTDLKSKLANTRIILFYDFAPRKEIKLILDYEIEVIRVNIPHLLMDRYINEAIDKYSNKTDNPVATSEYSESKRIFSSEQLYYLQEIDNKIECECPNQLSYLALALSSFVDYSNNCVNKNEADKIVHKKLAKTTSQALEIIENSLLELVKHENIQFPSNLSKR